MAYVWALCLQLHLWMIQTKKLIVPPQPHKQVLPSAGVVRLSLLARIESFSAVKRKKAGHKVSPPSASYLRCFVRPSSLRKSLTTIYFLASFVQESLFFPLIPDWWLMVYLRRRSLALAPSVTPHQSLACSLAVSSSWSITPASLVDREMLFGVCVRS